MDPISHPKLRTTAQIEIKPKKIIQKHKYRGKMVLGSDQREDFFWVYLNDVVFEAYVLFLLAASVLNVQNAD